MRKTTSWDVCDEAHQANYNQLQKVITTAHVLNTYSWMHQSVNPPKRADYNFSWMYMAPIRPAFWLERMKAAVESVETGVESLKWEEIS